MKIQLFNESFDLFNNILNEILNSKHINKNDLDKLNYFKNNNKLYLKNEYIYLSIDIIKIINKFINLYPNGYKYNNKLVTLPMILKKSKLNFDIYTDEKIKYNNEVYYIIIMHIYIYLLLT